MKRVYVVTSYIPNAGLDEKFIAALRQCVEHRRAEFRLLQTHFNYIQDLESPFQQAIQDEFAPFIVKGTEKLNSNLHISSYKSPINIIDPLSGMESQAAKLGCFIMGFPRQRFKTVPRMLRESHTPRAIWCTGSISEPYYKPTKSGIRMKEYHVKGALIVEIEDDSRFNIRQLEWDGKGFYDRNFYYTSDKVIDETDESVDAVSLGDDHATFNNPTIVDKTISLLKLLKPKKVFHHDTFDATSITHHVEGKLITKATINLTLEEEGEITANHMGKMSDSTKPWKAKHYLVASNHPEHLVRYLDEGRYLHDTFNHVLGLRLALREAEHKDALEWFLKTYCAKFAKLDRWTILKRKESFKVHEIELGDHGDEGASGARGSTKEKGIVYDGNSITGHTHAPEIGVFNNYVNGTMTHLVLPYTKDSGSSTWLNTHTVLYKNGKRTHEHIIP